MLNVVGFREETIPVKTLHQIKVGPNCVLPRNHPGNIYGLRQDGLHMMSTFNPANKKRLEVGVELQQVELDDRDKEVLDTLGKKALRVFPTWAKIFPQYADGN